MNTSDSRPGARPVTILVVGCGSIGTRHIANLKNMQAGVITAYDSDDRLMNKAKSDYGVRTSTSLEAALESAPDVVVVATPTDTHVPIALQAVDRGCHLFVEKPLSHDLGGVADVVKSVKTKDLVNMVGCNFRFHPGPNRIKKWLDDSVIGEIISSRIHCGSYLPGWRPWQDYRHSYSASTESGGAVLDVIHEIDLATWLLGDACHKASLTLPASSIGLETDGISEILLKHGSGAISSVHLNFIQRNYQRSILVIGSEGTLQWEFDGLDGECRYYGADGSIVEQVSQPAGWTMNDMYVDEMQYFMGCVSSGRQTFNDVASAEQTLRIAVEARRIEQ